MDPSRQDTTAQLTRDASLALPETGRVTASGFVVPRARGQDTRQTEIYADDVLLQDPYTGMPLVDELDLRAFGDLSWHLGVSPPEIHSVNSGGTLIYRMRRITRSGSAAGWTVGRPYGSAVWAQAQAHSSAFGQTRIYARQHKTAGSYRYYSDNGTPYSTDDDSYQSRVNNDRTSWQLVPSYDMTIGSHTVRALGIVTESDQGIPSLSAARDGTARETAAARLGAARWAYRPPLAESAPIVPSRVAAHAAVTRDTRTLRDPDRDILAAGEQASLGVVGRRGGLDASWEAEEVDVEASVTSSAADVHAAGPLNEQRSSRFTRGGYLGLAAEPWSGALVEVKGAAHRFRDLKSAGDDARELDTTGASLALGQTFGPALLYAQAARSTRAPSLLEEFGDGGRVLENGTIGPEKAQHREIGAEWRGSSGLWHLGVAGFRDQTADKIMILPALAQATRAQNIGVTRVTGAELRADVEPGEGSGALLYGSMTWLDARDLSGGGDRPLPLIPKRTGSVGLEQKIRLSETGPATAVVRWASRYQSDTFRDRSASIVVPGGWIHDAYADFHFPFASRSAVPGTEPREAAIGLAILNVLDVTRLDVEAPDTPSNHGKTAYSDLEGYPLPGRQWRLSVEAHF